ncbi:serine/threonine-protein kinase Sgk2 [Trichoderma ceciliae]
MAGLSRSEVIRSKPIGDGLNVFRDSFKSLCEELRISTSVDGLQHIGYEGLQSLALDIVSALLVLPASRILSSNSGNKNFFHELLRLSSAINSDDFYIERVTPLLEAVINNESDDIIWDKAYAAVAETTPLPFLDQPPRFNARNSIINSLIAFDTPVRSSSASQRGIEQTHYEVDQRILEELTGRIYYDVAEFFVRYFEGKVWTDITRDIYENSRHQYAKDRWSGWPEPSAQNSFFDWFMRFQDTVLSGLDRRYFTSANKVLRGSEADRKLDIFLAPANVAPRNGEHDWSNVLVIGEHKQNPDEDGSTKTLIQLAGYAREVFGSQPDRRFVPGFTICGSKMRLWVFDRSGSYSSENFDIHKEPERFIQVIAGYALMTDAELGLNTFIRRDGDKYIVAQGMRICLEKKPIACQRAIVCRGTACYRGRNKDPGGWEYVVKFAWPSDKRCREGELLKLAKERGVKGIAEWVHHEQINIDGHPDSISYLRRGMKFGRPRKLSSKADWVDSGVGSDRASSTTRSLWKKSRGSKGRLVGLGINKSSTTTASSGQKRKRDGFVDGSGGMKRSKLRDSRTNVEIATDAENGDPDTGNHHIIEEPEPDSLAGSDSETYDNRIYCCLVVSPAGRPLHAYRSTRELLEALRDAITGHRSLLEDGKILHRDISDNNVIIIEAASKGEPKGRLIDLDLAKELDSVPSGASHRTGTMQFMAIEVLLGKGHTYRHDLESFFYLLVWMCIRYGHEDLDGDENSMVKKRMERRIMPSRLRGWYSGTYNEIGRNKLGDMDKNGFEGIVAEFAPRFEHLKQLARELRKVLFPIRDGGIFIGTFRDHDIMYDGMIKAFNSAIASEGEEEEANA